SSVMTLSIPDDILREAGLTEREALTELACRLFDAEKLDFNAAARLAGLGRPELERELLARKLPIVHYGEEEFRPDFPPRPPHPPTDAARVAELRTRLDPGEAEAIVLALELKADALLIDERRGRQVAAQLGLRPIGVLGVLAAAKSRNLIPAVAPLVEQLRDR